MCLVGAAAWLVQGLIKHFPHEIEDRMEEYHAKHPKLRLKTRSHILIGDH